MQHRLPGSPTVGAMMRARGVLEWMMRAWGLLYTGEGEGVKGNRERHERERERHEGKGKSQRRGRGSGALAVRLG